MPLAPVRTGRRRYGLLAAAVAALTVAGLVPALAPAAHAATAPPLPPLYNARDAVPAGFQQVQLELKPRDQAGLAELARIAPTVPAAQRQAQRLEALAGPDRAGQVASIAQHLGLTLIATTDTSVTVAGTPDLVRSLFGSARENHPNLPTAQALPTLPASLQPLVLVAAGGDETRPAYLPQASRPRNTADGTLSQAEFQRVYGVPASQTPPTATSPTVATLQFSDWNDGDLATFTQQNKTYGSASYNPVTSGGYTRVTVDGGNTDFSGSGEVALDQESIATMAPSLRQRAYFTSNSLATGQADAINQVAQEAGRYHILTLSTSYGNCEADAYPGGLTDQTLQADQDAINNLIAAGVTMFAPSGDNGSIDCPNDHPGQNTVDVPAALPTVVSVGGTNVQTGGSSTTQTAWGCTTAGTACANACASQSNGGCTGGGYSAIFSRPAYQDSAVTNAMRGVPDLAMDGDPASGLDTYDSNPAATGGCGGQCGPNGGTSLATPLAASAMAAVLAARGATAGLGDIHTLLYQAPATAFMDVTSGSNGAFSAGPGWDPVSGLGAPMWSSLLTMPVGTTPYVPISPFRVVDTRDGTGGVNSGALQPGQSYTFSIGGTGLPTGQKAYAFNVTAIGPAGPGNLRLTPGCGAPAGTSSLVNYQPGATVANFVVVPNAATCNAFTLVSAGSAANVAIDAVGYYTSGFTGVGPTRIVDTRSGQGGTTGPIAAGTSASFQVAGTAGVPATATAVAINVTAVGPTGGGNLRVYPDAGANGTPPNASNVNYIPGVDKAVFDIVQLPADGKIDVYTAGSPVNVLIDVAGYYTDTSAVVPAAPVRVLDTRGLNGAPAQGLPSPLAANTPYAVTVTGGGVPANAAAVLVSVTAIHAASSTGQGNLRLYPAGQSLPNVSTVNYVSPTADVANFAIVKVGTNGQLDIDSAGSPMDVALDVVGYVPGG
ncbi:MAG TPA: S53 family peptidase [Mycobacteriales bacterium]